MIKHSLNTPSSLDTDKRKTTFGIGEVEPDFKIDKMPVSIPEAGKYFEINGETIVWVIRPKGPDDYLDKTVFFREDKRTAIQLCTVEEFCSKYEMRAG